MSTNPQPPTRAAKSKNPDRQRQEFSAKRYRVGSIELGALSMAHLWLFEEVRHPFNEAPVPKVDAEGRPVVAEDGTPVFESKPLSMRDTARAFYIFAAEEEASKALLEGGEAGFDAAARKFASTIAPSDIPAISAKIAEIFRSGLAGRAG